MAERRKRQESDSPPNSVYWDMVQYTQQLQQWHLSSVTLRLWSLLTACKI